MKKPITDVSAFKVTIIIPTWNNLYFTKRCFDSIANFVTVPYKVVFIDNGSKDGSAEYLKKLQAANPDRVEVIFNHTNKGFARAMNQGLEKAEGHVLWLNNDTQILRPGTIEKLVDLLESGPEIGAIGPVTDQVMGPQLVSMSSKYPQFHMARFLIGFCMLVKEEVWKKVGNLDEGFNNAGQDDLDYSIRIQQLGYRLAIDRTTFIHHVGGASQPKDGSYGEQEAQGRAMLVEKWGKEMVDQLFLPVDFSNIRVLVAIPAWDKIHPEAYANHMMQLMNEVSHAEGEGGTGMQIEFVPMIRSAICPARNELVRQALQRQCTHVMFIDDDMMIPQGAIHRMVEKNVPIVSGLCYLRTPPHYPSMFVESAERGDGKIFYIQEWPKGQTIKVDATGAACLLIKTEVFQKIAEAEIPGVKEAGQDLWFLYGKARPGENTVGEDVYFCRLARMVGYDVLVDTSIEFGHIGNPMIYDSRYFEQVRGSANGQMSGLTYSGYESTRDAATRLDGAQTPENLAAAMGEGQRKGLGEVFERRFAGAVGDGQNPGPISAAGNKGKTPRVIRNKPVGGPVPDPEGVEVE